MVNLKWYLFCLMPIGLIAMSGCSPPKSAPISQANNNPPGPVMDSAPNVGISTSEAKTDIVTPAEPVSESAGNNPETGVGNPSALGEQGVPSTGTQPENPDRMPQGNNSQVGLGEPEAGAAGGTDPGDMANNTAPKLPEFPGPTGKKGTGVGDLIPEISGKDMDKKSFKLSDYSGRVVMLDFWGDW